ncbi:MAG: PEP-CTERM sorting domain-containing protein [Burkholderiaceae bacterium]|nr:PEP-CTERM sorting domain-containing protein [Burkholderiaceae bacterium]
MADAYGRGYRFTFHDAVVTGPGPDPTTLLLAGLGVIGLWRRRRHDARG